MGLIPESEIRRGFTLEQLQFLRNIDWYKRLVKKANPKIGIEAQNHLIPAISQPGHCIDERIAKRKYEHISHLATSVDYGNQLPVGFIKPIETASMVAVSAGYTLAFIAAGLGTQQACKATAQFHERMMWPLKVHTDQHSLPHIIDGEIIIPHHSTSAEGIKLGCGALANAQHILENVQRVIFDIYGVYPPGIGNEIFHILVSDYGAQSEVLLHDHKLPNASIVMNQRKGSTISRESAYRDNPTFDWDSWATLAPETRDAFVNTSADFGLIIRQEVYGPLMTAITFATGLELGALRLGSNGNFGIIM